MNCEEISELLPAYVLGALDPDEVEAVELHLREGREHDAELTELRATVFAMDRLLGEEDLETATVEPPVPLRPLPTDRPSPASGGWAGLSRAWRAVAVAAAVLVLFGAGWVAGQLLSGDSETYAYALQGPDGAYMEVLGEKGSDTVTVVMAGLERLEDNSYQVWALRDGEWVSIGVCNTNTRGAWVGDFDFSIRPGEEIALTVEPRGGSGSPTSEPLLRSGLRP